MADITTISLATLIRDKLPLVVSTVAAILLAIGLQALLARNPLSDIPQIGQELGSDEKRRQAYLQGAKNLYNDGYRKVSCRMASSSAHLQHETYIIDVCLEPFSLKTGYSD
jgi:hypothetical protein